MKSIREAKIEQRRRRQRAFINTLGRVSLVAALTLFTALPSYPWTYYSGASVGGDGTVYGWGVTDVTQSGMYHTAYVNATLTSPKGRVANNGQVQATSSVREDLSLPFDATDLGNYLVSTGHSGFCHSCNCWLFANCGSGWSANDAPARLVPFDYKPCAPNGVGPMQPLNNQDVVDCNGDVLQTGWDGVNRNLMYELVDGTGAPYVGAYHIAESFSNFQKTPSNSGLTQPQARNADIPAYGLVGDYQYTGYKYPTYLGSNEYVSYTQSFTVTVGGTTYPLTTIVTMSLGNFSGTPEDNVKITTP